MYGLPSGPKAVEDFRIDLLFYHLKLRCYVVIDHPVGFRRRDRRAVVTQMARVDIVMSYGRAFLGIIPGLCSILGDIVIKLCYTKMNTSQSGRRRVRSWTTAINGK
jgi:hypothetical protein